MYAGTTLTKYSGRVLGAHQKLDRLARRQLALLLNNTQAFPTIRQILYFEGVNGPDAIKRKSPAKDEPWHYFNPFQEGDTELLDLIDIHSSALAQALHAGDMERAAFDAAWLAHAIVDGLTPAHHFPYEEEVSKLRGGLDNASRTTIKEKLVMHGETQGEKIVNNWRMWGTKGLMTTHGGFEWGFSFLITSMSVAEITITDDDKDTVRQLGFREYFVRLAREVAVMDLFDEFYETGWNMRLAYKIRYRLAPKIASGIVMAWYAAIEDSKQ